MAERMSADEYRKITDTQSDRGYGSWLTVGNRIVACNPEYDEAELSVMVRRILGHHGWHEPRHANEHTKAFVFSTEQRRRSGVTEGLPDLFVQIPFSMRYLAVELKTPRGKLSDVQRLVHDKLGSVVWRSPADAWEWAEEATP